MARAGTSRPTIPCGNWQKHPLRKIEYKLEYFDDFANLVLDVNGDGYPDITSGGFFSGKMFWYENPGQAGGEWKEHLIDTRFIETARAVGRGR